MVRFTTDHDDQQRRVGRNQAQLESQSTNLSDLQQTPIRLALSGPAAAGNAIVRVAHDLGLAYCVGLDVGGTSADIVVVRDGRLWEMPPEEREIGGYPLQVSMLDLHTIGAGGGSLVFRDAYGALHVGPESAGADPGPACYQRGGTRPTVTDAAVVTQRLPTMVKLGGHLPIRQDLALDAFGSTFEISPEEAISVALDALALAEAQIAFAIRERTVARGLNPQELALVAAGGAGPLLACGVAEALELAEVVIPPRPGLLAAWGLLAAPDRREAVVTILRLLRDMTVVELDELREKATASLPQKPPAEADLHHTCALRYLGQGFEVDVPLKPHDTLTALAERFHHSHQHEYGFALPKAPVEWVELRAAWEIAPREWAFPDSIEPAQHTTNSTVWEHDLQTNRPVQHQARILSRQGLGVGTLLDGPTIVLDQDTTIYVPKDWHAQVVDGGYIRVRR